MALMLLVVATTALAVEVRNWVKIVGTRLSSMAILLFLCYCGSRVIPNHGG